MVKAGEALPARAVTITFDDGYKSTCTRAWPILRLHGFPFSVFLATRFIGRSVRFPWLPPDGDRDVVAMGWEDARAMSRVGAEVGSHTDTHRFPAPMAEGEIDVELSRSSEEIGARLGRNPFAIALPFSFPSPTSGGRRSTGTCWRP
jgi:peptidoglycan/xylan/chitin deacetylase (PgdA/CDA1 family)